MAQSPAGPWCASLRRCLSHPSPRAPSLHAPAFLHIRHLGRPSKHLEEGGTLGTWQLWLRQLRLVYHHHGNPWQRAPGGGPEGRVQARGRPESTTPARCAHSALPEALKLSECPTPPRPHAQAPRNKSPRNSRPRPAPGSRCNRWPASPQNPTCFSQQDAAQSHFQDGAGKTQRPRRGGVSKAGVRGRSRGGAILTLPERSRGLAS